MNQREELYFKAQLFAVRIVAALDCIGELSAMNQVFSKGQNADVLKKATHFFRTAQQAMVFRYQIEVAKLFENDGKVMGFLQFKNELKRTNLIQKDVCEQFESKCKCQDVKDSLKAIKDRRDKILAHADLKYAEDIATYQKENRFNLEIVIELLEMMLTICNYAISRYTDSFENMYGYINNDDFLKLFDYETSADRFFDEWTPNQHKKREKGDAP